LVTGLLNQHETAIQHKAAKLKFLVDLHANELLETLGDVRDAGLKQYEKVKASMQRCRALTDDFLHYANEVTFSFSLLFFRYRYR